MKKQIVLSTLLLITFIVLLVILGLDLYPLIKEIIANADDESQMISYISAYGGKGIVILIGLQALCVFIPGIPSMPISILSGLCYGVAGGTAISCTGILLTNSIVFFVVQHFQNIKNSFKKENALLKKLLEKCRNIKAVIWFAYLIPFIPNLILPFVFSSRKVPYKTYLLYMSAAVIPAALLYNCIGGALSH